MNKSNVKWRGFGTVETIVIALVVVVIAGAGVVLYKNNHKNSNTSYNKGLTDSQIAESTKLQTDNTKDMTVQPAQTVTGYVVIKEWGVEAPYSGSLTLGYTMNSSDTVATFSSDQLTATSSACTGRGGSIERWASTDKVTAYPSDPSAPTAAQAFASAAASTYAHIGNYYYAFEHDQAACGDPTTTSSLYSQTNNAVQALVPNLQAVSSSSSN